MTTRGTLVTAVSMLALALSGCGGEVEKSAAAPAPSVASSAPAPTATTPTATTPTAPDATEEPEEEPTSLASAFGDPVSFTENDEDAITITVAKPKLLTKTPGEFPDVPENKYFAVFSISARAAKTFDINPYDFYVRGDDGAHYDGAFASVEPDLHPVTLNAGEKVKGNVVFDIPSKHATLVYAPGSSALSEWSF